MLRKYIEHREHFLHGRDNNRKSLPFDWGTEHLGIHGNGNSATALQDFALRALNDSASFYTYERRGIYNFDGEILSFPSAVLTPYEENNTVWGGFTLPARILPSWFCLSGIASGRVRWDCAGPFSVPVLQPYG